MALCASCGSVSARGAVGCAACGRPLGQLGAVVVDEPTDPGAQPERQLNHEPGQGSWGSGVPYRPVGSRNWVTGADWRPALKAVLAPTALLLVAALALSFARYDFLGALPPYSARFGGALSLVLSAFGAPWHVVEAQTYPFGSFAGEHAVHLLPMTVTAGWAALLWFGLRRGQRARQALAAPPTRGGGYTEAARTALVAALVTLLIGLPAGADWRMAASVPLGLTDGSDVPAPEAGLRVTAESGLLWAVGGTMLLAGAVALAVYGADELRALAARSARVRDWLQAAGVAGRALLITLGVLSAAAFVLVALAGTGTELIAALTVLPNLALLLLGFGSGATLTARAGYQGGPDDPNGGTVNRASLFDLGDLGGEWRMTVLAALLGALVLAWCAHRRGLDRAGRVRLAVLYGVALSALTSLSGLLVSSVMQVTANGSTVGDLPPGTSQDDTLSLGWSGLAATLVWTALGALLLPVLLARLGPAAPQPWPLPDEAAETPETPGPGPTALLPASTEVLDSGHREP